MIELRYIRQLISSTLPRKTKQKQNFVYRFSKSVNKTADKSQKDNECVSNLQQYNFFASKIENQKEKTTWSDAAANCLSKQTADIDVLNSYYHPQIYPPSHFNFYSPFIFIFSNELAGQFK